jgi:hypothetical protein
MGGILGVNRSNLIYFDRKTISVIVAGKALVYIDVFLLVVWICAGIAIGILDGRVGEDGERFLVTHVLLSLHFVVTVSVCLVLEYYAEVSNEWKRAKERKSETNASDSRWETKNVHWSPHPVVKETPEACSFVEKPVYLSSWAIAIAVGLFQDVFSLLDVCIGGRALGWDAARIIEATIAGFGTTTSLLTVVWSLWLFFKLRKTVSKLKSACQQRSQHKKW